jgi:hypothetical protein
LLIDSEAIYWSQAIVRNAGATEGMLVWKERNGLVLVVQRPCGLELFDGERAKTHGIPYFSISDVF